MKKIALVIFSVLFSNFLFSQVDKNLIKSELIIKFKADKKPINKEVEIWENFFNRFPCFLDERFNIQWYPRRNSAYQRHIGIQEWLSQIFLVG